VNPFCCTGHQAAKRVFDLDNVEITHLKRGWIHWKWEFHGEEWAIQSGVKSGCGRFGGPTITLLLSLRAVYLGQQTRAQNHLFLGSLTLEIELNKIRNLRRQFFIGFWAKPPWLAEPIPRGEWAS
jgi:hypothetical protein